MVDGEGLDARLAIPHRPGEQREAGDHIAVDDVVILTAGDVAALLVQDAETIAKITVTLRLAQFGLADEGTGRAVAIALLGGPVEPVGLAFAAYQLLGIFEDTITVVIIGSIIALGIDISVRSLDGREFVLADAPVDHLF